jgi:hypothetical protein
LRERSSAEATILGDVYVGHFTSNSQERIVTRIISLCAVRIARASLLLCLPTISMADLYKPQFLGKCQCHSPWLTPRRDPNEACADDLRLLPRSATNTYFPQTVTVISLTKTNDKLRQAIAENKTTIDSIRALPNFVDVLRAIPQMSDAFEDSNEEILKALSDGQEGRGKEQPTRPQSSGVQVGVYSNDLCEARLVERRNSPAVAGQVVVLERKLKESNFIPDTTRAREL